MLSCLVILVWFSAVTVSDIRAVPTASIMCLEPAYQCAKHVSAVLTYHHFDSVMCVRLLVRLTSVAVYHCACTCQISLILYVAQSNYEMLHLYVLCTCLMQCTLRTLDVVIIYHTSTVLANAYRSFMLTDVLCGVLRA